MQSQSQTQTQQIILKPVSQLAAPRGVNLIDELTGNGAALSLDVCGLTYYYQTRESAELDYSVLSLIGPLLADLSFEQNAQGTAQEREVHTQRARTLMIEIARVTLELASQRVISKDFERSKPAALRCLRMLQQLHGESSPQLVPAYLALAEAALGSGAADKAEEFLSLCSFVLSKQEHQQNNAHNNSFHRTHLTGHLHLTEEEIAEAEAAEFRAAEAMRSRLHRNFGWLYASQGNTSAAIGAFSHDIMHCTRATGAESIEAAPGYFNLGRSFALQGDSGAAHSCFNKVLEIWQLRLSGKRSSIAACIAELARNSALPLKQKSLSAVEAAEGLEILAEISAAREEKFGANHISVAEVRFTAALILDATNEGKRAGQLLNAALEVFTKELDVEHEMRKQAEALSIKLNLTS